ncbi:acyltransferase family protein [Aquihabitans daechungensis]|uniref:acyltransferase family protein n=1 Tax=Aquihabitans daechungensis TaxID=1052257 RepID=UPI003BA12195
MPTPPKPAHVPALDGLRGAAVAAVVAFHLGYLDGGYLGVDLFFTLSGFLITRLLIVEHQHTGGIALGAFLGRRARRLMPALLVMLAGVAVVTNFWGSTSDFAKVRGDSLATLGYVANWRSVLADSDYWALFSRPSPLQHTWSLAIEEQFYLLWPLIVTGVLVGVVRWRTRRLEDGSGPGAHRATALSWMLGITLGIAALSAGAAALAPEGTSGVNRIYFGTDTRVASILFGAALALLVARFGEVSPGRQRQALEVGALIAVVGLGIAWFALSGTSGFLYDGGLALCGLAAAVVIAAISHSEPGLLSRALSFRPLCYLGLISYGIYLWHWPVITTVTAGRVGFGGLELTALRIGLSLGLALLSFYLIEQPIRHGALTGWPARLSAPVGFAAVGLLVVWATAGGVIPLADQPTGREALRVADDPVPAVKQASMRLLLVGDSGAYAFGEALGEVGAANDVEVVGRGTPACGVARGDGLGRYPTGEIVKDPPGCRSWPTRWAEHLTEVEPDAVLLLMVAPGGVERKVDGRWQTDCNPGYDRWYQEELEMAFRVLGRRGARVSVATVAYYDSTIDPDASYRHTACKNQTIRRAAEAGRVSVVDLAGWTCQRAGDCKRHVTLPDGSEAELRPDGMHYSGPGAVVPSEWVIRQLTAK